MKVWVVIDEGCQECGVSSEPVGIYTNEAEAVDALEKRDADTAGWRDGGQTIAQLYTFDMDSGERVRLRV